MFWGRTSSVLNFHLSVDVCDSSSELCDLRLVIADDIESLVLMIAVSL